MYFTNIEGGVRFLVVAEGSLCIGCNNGYEVFK